jgi:2-oxoisovalerate dehydrogenase E1 component alpha subunit
MRWHCRCPHAVGAAKALRLMGQRSVALTYFGEGCASEGDIPSALNIAAVHKAPAIFFCRNNGYAISTQVHEAARGGGWAGGAIGWMGGLRLLPTAVSPAPSAACT